MQMIGGSFPRLKDPLKFEELDERKVYFKVNGPTVQLPDVSTWY